MAPAAVAATRAAERTHPRLKHAASCVNMRALRHAVVDDHDYHVIGRSNSLSELQAWHDDGGTENRRPKSVLVHARAGGGRGKKRKKRRGTVTGASVRESRAGKSRRRQMARAQSSQRLVELIKKRKEAGGGTALDAIKEEVRSHRGST